MVKSANPTSFRERFNISRLAIRYSRLTVCFWLAVTVAGLLAFSSLKYALFPEINFPVVVINATGPFDTVVDTEVNLTQPLESKLQSLDNLEDLTSSTYSGQTVTNLFFATGTNLQASKERVDRALQDLSLAPEATLEVIPFNLNESAAVSYAILSKDKNLTELIEIAKEKIIPELTQLPGVLKVNLLGDASQQNANSDFPTLVRFNGEDGLAVQVVKLGDANTLEVVSEVETIAQQLQQEIQSVQLILAETQAGYIEEATQATIDALILAIILAILVIFLFLRNWQATLITALAIPISLLGTCIVMAIAGLNLETLTLLALALVIGIIVDDAIVDVENIARHIEKGETPKQAAIKGTDEIGLTVSASTLTIVAVFLPVAFMGGTLGQFFKPFGLTVSAAVFISLLVARTLSPVLAAYWLKANPKLDSEKLSEETNRERINRQLPIANIYRNLLVWSLNHRKIVVGIAVLILAAGIDLIPLIPKGFIPQLDRGQFTITYTTPLPKLPEKIQPQTPPTEPEATSSGTFDWLAKLAKSPSRIFLRRTRRIGEDIEQVVLAFPDIESVFTVVGVRGEPNKGKISVRLNPNRQMSTAQVQEQLRAAISSISRLEDISVEDIPFVETDTEKPFQVALLGKDLTVLNRSATEIKTRLEKLPGFADVSTTAPEDQSKETLKIDHFNSQRVVYLSANLAQGQALGNANEQVVAIAESVLPPEVTLRLHGDSARVGEIIGDFGITLGLSVIFMLVVLILLFGRFLEPVVVGLSLPLAVVGAMLALLVTQSEFGMISLIGLIFLLGLLDKNALLLMDYANQLRHAGLSRTKAILETGTVRLRPILMTTASTILGMLPIALGWGAGAELRQPMAVAIIGGLLTASLLSLIVVPVLYTLLEDGWLKIRSGKL